MNSSNLCHPHALCHPRVGGDLLRTEMDSRLRGNDKRRGNDKLHRTDRSSNLLLSLFLVLLYCFNISLHAAPLPVDEAFQIQAEQRAHDIQVYLQIQKGHALYRDKLRFLVDQQPLKPLYWPPSNRWLHGDKVDLVYDEPTTISLPPPSQPAKQLVIHYQGCSEGLDGHQICYPPQTTTISLQPTMTHDIPHTKKISWKELLSFFVAGVFLALTPCIWPMLPILSAVILGHHTMKTSQATLLACSYVLGMASAYALAGILVAQAGFYLQGALQSIAIKGMASTLLVGFGLLLLANRSLMPTRWQNALHQLSQKPKAGTLLGVFLMGFLASLILSPCVSAPLAGALTYIAQSGDAYWGGSALFLLGLGSGLPLLFIVLFGNHYLPKAGHWMEWIKYAFAWLLFAMAIYIWMGSLPELHIQALFGLLIFLTPFLFSMLHAHQHPLQRIVQGIGALLLIIGMAWMAPAIPMLFNPQPTPETRVHDEVWDHTVTNAEELHRLIEQINTKTIVEFYAKWCSICRANEPHFVKLKAQHPHWQFIKADITQQDKSIKGFMKAFQIFAPPTTLVYENGKQVERIEGNVRGRLW